jgi:hypothetical protein
MPKVLLKFKQKKQIQLTVLCLLFFTAAFAQNKIIISYGEKIDFGNTNKEVHFYILSDAKQVHLRGNAINDYKFMTPGTYHIKVEEKQSNKKASCTEKHFPKEIVVEVSRIKMNFDKKDVTFSSPITKNKSTDGITLQVPVTTETYDHLPAKLDFTPVRSAGIGTNITATLGASFKELPEGTHLLQYSLHGVVTENSYLMFDFIDANGKIQSAPLLTPITN